MGKHSGDRAYLLARDQTESERYLTRLLCFSSVVFLSISFFPLIFTWLYKISRRQQAMTSDPIGQGPHVPASSCTPDPKLWHLSWIVHSPRQPHT